MLFPLHIFPTGLSSSIITTVMVGAIVTVFLNFRFGWTIFGLVIPGYMVPLLIIHPWLAFSTAIEAFVTYLITYFFIENMHKTKISYNYYGREIFLLIIAISVVVRMFFDSAIFPFIGQLINQIFHINFDYLNNLHTYGILIIALLAHSLIKPGLKRGWFPLLVKILLTYLIVRYILMGLTNFSLSNLSFLYSSIVTYIESSPKTYIILIVTLVVAARYATQYSWEYSRIIIPALLAVSWYEPYKIATSFIEAIIIYNIALLLIKTPLLRSANIQKGNKLLLFFGIGYAYKLCLAYFLLIFFPTVKTIDYFGFGYLLSTLLAIKMYDSESAPRVFREVFQVIFISIIISIGIGYSLTLIPRFTANKHAIQTARNVYTTNNSFDSFLQSHQKTLYLKRTQPNEIISQKDMYYLITGLNELLHYPGNYSSLAMEKIITPLNKIHYQVQLLKDNFIYVGPENSAKNMGEFFINKNNINNCVVTTPYPLLEYHSAKIGGLITKLTRAKLFYIPPVIPIKQLPLNQDILSKYLNNIVLRKLGYTQIINVRTEKSPYAEMPEYISHKLITKSSSYMIVGNQIECKSQLLQIYKKLIKNDKHNIQIIPHKKTATLYFAKQDIDQILSLKITQHQQKNLAIFLAKNQSIQGYLDSIIYQKPNTTSIAEKGSQKYVKPTIADMLFFDEEIFQPLLQLLNQYQNIRNNPAAVKILNLIAANAANYGYTVIDYFDKNHDNETIALAENHKQSPHKYWGIYIFRVGLSLPYIIQTPRPLADTDSIENGLKLFNYLQAKALLIAGSHPFANLNNDANVISVENIGSIFSLCQQVMLRDSKHELFPIQIRSYVLGAQDKGIDADIVVAFSNGAWKPLQFSEEQIALFELLKKHYNNIKFADGGQDTAKIKFTFSAQTQYLQQSMHKNFAILWFNSHNQTSMLNDKIQLRQFNIIGIQSVHNSLNHYISLQKCSSETNLPKKLITSIDAYADKPNILHLHAISSYGNGYRFVRLIDYDSTSAYLLIFHKLQLHAIVNISDANKKGTMMLARHIVDSFDFDSYTKSNLRWLMWK